MCGVGSIPLVSKFDSRVRLAAITFISFYMRDCWNWQTGSVEVAVFVRAYEFKSHIPHQIPFALSVEAMSFTFIPRFNYPELSNNSLRFYRICRCGGMVDTRRLGRRVWWRAGSSPVIGTIWQGGAVSPLDFKWRDTYARMLKLVDKSVSKTDAVKRVGPSPTLSTKALCLYDTTTYFINVLWWLWRFPIWLPKSNKHKWNLLLFENFKKIWYNIYVR